MDAFGQPSTGQSFAAPVASTSELASFWQRFGAALLDGILLGVVNGILDLALKDAGSALGFLIGICYFTYFEGTTGITPGKNAAGIRVADVATGEPIGYGRALLRYFARLLSAIPLFLGYFWMLWDDKNQCWHDKICTDVVVKR